MNKEGDKMVTLCFQDTNTICYIHFFQMKWSNKTITVADLRKWKSAENQTEIMSELFPNNKKKISLKSDWMWFA